ncbi:MAG: radical SAM protein [Archaeoglobaceae archaeon]|nr:radical SAM protein [Archaeoglobaceae archaeon]MCX8152008.1 radical SAM protein [Archaeoglobaceae archaeon]MDW8013397.1 radical SAM protein [Archaeoglobaceae archaeon]
MMCRMVEQGYEPGKCLVKMPDNSYKPACVATLKKEKGLWYRLICSAHLSRPEDYYSIYQSGCNHDCLKCHSWYFTKIYNGSWLSTDEIAELVSDYELTVTVHEPRERATMFHATDLCHHCGLCVTRGIRGWLCPEKLDASKITLSPQGFGPARNIVSFTGGDLVCCAEFYAQATEKIKDLAKVFVLIETNGYGLTPKNLDLLASSGVDSFWLDIKAYHEETYRKLCGTKNEWILKSVEEIVDRGFVLEVLALFIPNWVEEDQIVKIAELVCKVDPKIPFTLLAFFPEYKLSKNRPPSFWEMVKTYFMIKDVGLKNVKLGNCHVFAKTVKDWENLIALVGKEAIG